MNRATSRLETLPKDLTLKKNRLIIFENPVKIREDPLELWKTWRESLENPVKLSKNRKKNSVKLPQIR